MKCELESILREAGALMKSYADPHVTVKPGHANFVTEADVAVQALLEERLAKMFPKASFLAEEEEEHRLGQGLTFIIDPIDGTTNYMRHRPDCGISVGAVENGQPVLGAVYLPYKDELYHAAPGKGAWCNGTQLHVSDVPMERALVMLGTAPYNTELAELTAKSVQTLLLACGDVRRSGAAVVDLCDLAAGRAEVQFEWTLQPWDCCASTLIIREAGGIVGNILGGDVRWDQAGPYLAAAPQLYEPVRKLLLEARSSLGIQ